VIVDYHVHHRGPADGREGPIEHTLTAVERYVEAAAVAGVDEVAFTGGIETVTAFDARKPRQEPLG
jgi:hypothetical protein